MSKGLGKVSRALKAEVDRLSYTLLYGCASRIYFGDGDATIERKHKVSIMRAAKALVATGQYRLSIGILTQEMELWGYQGKLYIEGYVICRAEYDGFPNNLDDLETQSEMARRTDCSQSTVHRGLKDEVHRSDGTLIRSGRFKIDGQEAWFEPHQEKEEISPEDLDRIFRGKVPRPDESRV